jgi:GNAT superfamily N-acetyltransferase
VDRVRTTPGRDHLERPTKEAADERFPDVCAEDRTQAPLAVRKGAYRHDDVEVRKVGEASVRHARMVGDARRPVSSRVASPTCRRAYSLRMEATTGRSGWEVRPAAPSDVEAIRTVASAAWRDTYDGLLDRATIEAFVERAYSVEIVERRINGLFLVAVHDEHLIAFADAVVGDDRLSLAAIYALPQQRGQGAGTLLLEALRSRFPRLPIAADVLVGNRKGEVFYERRGFTPRETIEAELFGEPVVERRWWLPPRVASAAEDQVSARDATEPV